MIISVLVIEECRKVKSKLKYPKITKLYGNYAQASTMAPKPNLESRNFRGRFKIPSNWLRFNEKKILAATRSFLNLAKGKIFFNFRRVFEDSRVFHPSFLFIFTFSFQLNEFRNKLVVLREVHSLVHI